jgi:hypothetical protein
LRSFFDGGSLGFDIARQFSWSRFAFHRFDLCDGLPPAIAVCFL